MGKRVRVRVGVGVGLEVIRRVEVEKKEEREKEKRGQRNTEKKDRPIDLNCFAGRERECIVPALLRN